MNALAIEPSAATLGAIVTGVNLKALEAAQWSIIEAALNEHAVLVFPGQHLSNVPDAAPASAESQLADAIGAEASRPRSVLR